MCRLSRLLFYTRQPEINKYIVVLRGSFRVDIRLPETLIVQNLCRQQADPFLVPMPDRLKVVSYSSAFRDALLFASLNKSGQGKARRSDRVARSRSPVTKLNGGNLDALTLTIAVSLHCNENLTSLLFTFQVSYLFDLSPIKGQAILPS